MPGRRRWSVLVSVPIVLGLGVFPGAQPQAPANHEQFASSGQEWPLVGGDWSNKRFSTLTAITPANAKDLRGAWVSEPFADGATSRANPVVRNGLMFVTTQTRVYALDAKTGRTVWSRNPANRGDEPGVVVPGEPGFDAVTAFRIAIMKGGQIVPNTQGVAVAQGLVFVGLYGGEVVALREKTGEQVWRTQTADDPAPRGQGVSAAATYANGMVFVGTINGDFGNRTRAVALDAATGRKLWQFFVVPGPGEPGHETWPKDNDNWKIGGGGVWKVAAVDPDLGLVYFGTGNAFPGYAGELRAGDNLYTGSVLALEMKTGKLRWYRQLIHHDLWEGDMRQPFVLYDIEVGGRMRKAIAALRTDTYFFLFDRATGEPIIPVEERPVPQDKAVHTSPTQPYPVGVKRIVPDCTSWDGAVPPQWKAAAPPGFQFRCAEFVPPSPTIRLPQYVMPSAGAGTAPMSYSPQTGYVYTFASGGGFEWRTRRSPDPNFFNAQSPLRMPGRRPSTAVNLLVAIDARTGGVVWKRDARPAAQGIGGTLATASGLLMYTVAANGTIELVDARTGDLAFEMPTGGPLGLGGAPTTYEIDGEQYIAVAWGPEVRAFRLRGALPLPPMAERRAAAPASEMDSAGFSGPIEEAEVVETATLFSDLGNNGGARYFADEFVFKPYRKRARPGERVVFGNNGTSNHTIVALDGSWTTGTIIPAQTVAVIFDKPGNYGYHCKEHPWSYGEIVVEDPRAARARPAAFPDSQIGRGQQGYNQRCSQCHGSNLGGVGATPALAAGFLGRSSARTVNDLFTRIRSTMPQGTPGTLSEQEYLDITAFLLRANEFPGPDGELKPDSDALKLPLSGTNR